MAKMYSSSEGAHQAKVEPFVGDFEKANGGGGYIKTGRAFEFQIGRGVNEGNGVAQIREKGNC